MIESSELPFAVDMPVQLCSMFGPMTRAKARRWGLVLDRGPFHLLVYGHLVCRLLPVRVVRGIGNQTYLPAAHLAAQRWTDRWDVSRFDVL
jgi:hypothetical protein